MVLCPDDLLEEAIRRSTALGFPLPPIPYSELSDDSLRAHWRAIHAHFVPTAPYFGHEPTLTRRLDLAPTNLPRRWLARQMQGEDASRVVIDSDDVDSLINKAFWEQNILAATSRLEREGATPESADQRIPRVIEEERDRLRVPVTLALPGVASAYSRLAYDRSVRERIQPLTAVDETDTWSVELNQRSDALTERAAIELVAAHQAVARGGIGLMLPSVPQKAFTVLAELEQHFKVGARGPTVWRMLDQLHTAAQPLWSDALGGWCSLTSCRSSAR